MISADAATWGRIAKDVRGGMRAFRSGRLHMRGSLHLGVGFLAATSGSAEPGRLTFDTLRTRSGRVSIVSAGTGEQTLLCLHGLGGTKASFLPTLAALADEYRVVAMDLPGFGESDKPIGAPYNSAWFARTVFDTLDELGLEPGHARGQQHGRAGGHRGGPRFAGAGGGPRAAEPGAGLASRPPLGPPRAPDAPRARPLPGDPAPAGGGGAAAPDAHRVRRLGGGRDGRVPAGLPDADAAAPPSTPPRATSTSTSPTATTASGPAWPRSGPIRCSCGASTTRWCRWAFAATWRGRWPRRATWS